VSGRFAVVVFTEAEIIFVSVDNERAAPKISDLDTGQKVSIRFCLSGSSDFNISKITGVSGFRI
jgi:hypothetical protein